jgi:hypothetical protein
MNTKNLAATLVPLALLWSCGTPLVWRGPPGSGQQELAEARSECQHQAQAWGVQNAREYKPTPIDQGYGPQYQRQSVDDFYRMTDQIFQRCMTDKGYALVAANR